MKVAWRFVRRWWWAILLATGVVAAVLWKVFGPRMPDADVAMPHPKFIDLARDKVERVHLEGEIEKAKIRTEADGKRKQIEAIEEKGKTDPAAARKQLAEFLAANL